MIWSLLMVEVPKHSHEFSFGTKLLIRINRVFIENENLLTLRLEPVLYLFLVLWFALSARQSKVVLNTSWSRSQCREKANKFEERFFFKRHEEEKEKGEDSEDFNERKWRKWQVANKTRRRAVMQTSNFKFQMRIHSAEARTTCGTHFRN